MTTDDFVTIHGGSTFRHSEELFAAIHSGACLLTTSALGDRSLPCSNLLSIYRTRTNMLRERNLNSLHANGLLSDLEALTSELERSQDEPCGVWCFSLQPHHMIDVFEALHTHRILGCIRAVDDRLIDEETRNHIWHDATGSP